MSNPITTEDLNFIAEKIKELRDQEEEMSRAKKLVTAELESAEARMLEMLLESEIKNYRAPAGLCSITFRSSIKVPRTPEDIALLAEYLRGKGKFDTVFKPNSASLNSCWKEEFEAAQEAGQEDYAMPGIEGVTITPNLSFRK